MAALVEDLLAEAEGAGHLVRDIKVPLIPTLNHNTPKVGKVTTLVEAHRKEAPEVGHTLAKVAKEEENTLEDPKERHRKVPIKSLLAVPPEANTIPAAVVVEATEEADLNLLLTKEAVAVLLPATLAHPPPGATTLSRALAVAAARISAVALAKEAAALTADLHTLDSVDC